MPIIPMPPPIQTVTPGQAAAIAHAPTWVQLIFIGLYAVQLAVIVSIIVDQIRWRREDKRRSRASVKGSQ